VLGELGRGEPEISRDEIESFCKNAGYLKVICYRSIHDEHTSPRIKFIRLIPLCYYAYHVLEGEFENEFPPTLIHYYLALRAYDRFVEHHSRSPGSIEACFDEDIATLVSYVNSILGEPPANTEMVTNACLEMYSLHKLDLTNSARAGGGELHNIASLMGGLVAQEAIKLLTRQYIPCNNTCVFDGVSSSSNVWEM
jgi:NEDD8-activating enzyme E1 regulatory subunit